MKGKTHYEDGRYYAVIMTQNGHEYYSGGFKSRSSAYRYSVRESEKHSRARRSGFIYNTRH